MLKLALLELSTLDSTATVARDVMLAIMVVTARILLCGKSQISHAPQATIVGVV